jgi:uroporphyrinogen-III synthase
MHALQGLGVLVTRPPNQALNLSRLLESAGAMVVRLPALDIKATPGLDDLKRRLGGGEPLDLIIFTSANAVRFGMPLLDRRRDLKLAAIGPATARALESSGLRVAVTPAGGFDTEHLLSHPELARLDGRRVLLVKGVGGRELLQEQLEKRGASVTVAHVYQRERIRHGSATLAAIHAHFAAGEIHVVTATSAEIAEGLIELATPALRRNFDEVHWLVPGARVAAALRERGLTAPILQADSADDQDLVAALVRWRSSVSGA